MLQNYVYWKELPVFIANLPITLEMKAQAARFYKVHLSKILAFPVLKIIHLSKITQIQLREFPN